jgi:signal transduction histidine kinase
MIDRSAPRNFPNCHWHPIHFHWINSPVLDPARDGPRLAILTNIANHAKAQTVDVNLNMNDKTIILTVQDDGIGFDTSSIPSGHYGILGIKERVRLVNGSFEIQSENGKGTILKIEIPTPPTEPFGDNKG